MNYKGLIFNILFLAIAVFSSCEKIPGHGVASQAPLTFSVPVVRSATKTITNQAMGLKYNTAEQFVVFAAYSEENFDPSSAVAFWPGGEVCTYDETITAWRTSQPYYWPLSGKLTFQAYSPAGAENSMTSPGGSTPALEHSWTSGFTFHNYTTPEAGSQFDLLYTDRIENREKAHYTGDPYDDDDDSTHDYNGIDLTFKHALSLLEFRFSHPLNAQAKIKFWLTKLRVLNAYSKGTFTTNSWGNTPEIQTDYVVYYDWNDDFQRPNGIVLNGSGDPLVITPDIPGVNTMILLPQALDHGSDGHVKIEVTFRYGTDLKEAKENTATIDLVTGNNGNYFSDGENAIERWEIGKKYIYTIRIIPKIFQIFLDPSVQSDWTQKDGSASID